HQVEGVIRKRRGSKIPVMYRQLCCAAHAYTFIAEFHALDVPSQRAHGRQVAAVATAHVEHFPAGHEVRDVKLVQPTGERGKELENAARRKMRIAVLALEDRLFQAADPPDAPA